MLEGLYSAFSLNRRFTSKLRAGISANYFLNESDPEEFSGSSHGRDEETFSIGPSIRYDFTNDLAIEFNYRFTREQDNDDNTEAERNICFIRLVYEYDFTF